MGVYSNARYLTENVLVEAPEPDLSYRASDGANRIIFEMVQNDLKFFEAIINSDIQQAYIENAINAGETNLKDKLIGLQEAAAESIWGKIVAFLKKVWAKISGWFVNIINKFRSLFADNAKFVKIYKDKVSKNEDNLKSMTFSWYRMKKKDFANKLDGQGVAIAQNAKKIFDDVNGIMTSRSDSTAEVEADITKLQNELDNKEKLKASICSYYLGNSSDVSDINKAVHNYFFNSEIEKDTFWSLRDHIETSLTKSSETLDSFEKDRNDINKFFNDNIKELSAIEKTWNGKKGDRTVNTGDNVTTIKDGTASKNTIVARSASVLQKYYSFVQSCYVSLVNGKIAAYNFNFKQMRKIYAQAASYSGSVKKEETILFDAIGESVEFEFDMLMDELDYSDALNV